MVAQLIRQEDGSYEYEEVDTRKKTVTSNVNEFEAYEGAKKGGEELVSGPSITEQTEKIQREIPGRVEFDEQTGQFITKKAQTIDLKYKEPERTAESTEMTALQKVMNMEPMAGTSDGGLERAYSLIEQRNKLAAQQQKFDQYTQLAQTGMQLYNIVSGKDYSVFTGGGINPNAFTPIKAKSSALGMPVGQSTLGGVAGAGAIAYGVGSAFKVKEKKGMAAGASIGMAVGGPIGAVVGSVAGGIVESVFGGSVICTELYRQKLMSKEDCRLSWNFTINNFSSTHINGYWYWAVPVTKIMKKNKLVTKFWNHIMSNRTKDIKWRLGKNKFNLLGRLYSILIENGSYIIGRLIEKKKTKEVLV